MTKTGRERSYRVLMTALAEEARIGALSSDDIARRERGIYQSCFGAEPSKMSADWEALYAAEDAANEINRRSLPQDKGDSNGQ